MVWVSIRSKYLDDKIGRVMLMRSVYFGSARVSMCESRIFEAISWYRVSKNG